MRLDVPDIVRQLRKEEQQSSNDNFSKEHDIQKHGSSSSADSDSLTLTWRDDDTVHMIDLLIKVAKNSEAMVVITDSSGTIEYVNTKFSKVSGYEPEEVLGKNPRILKSGDHQADFYEQLWSTISSGHIWTGEIHNKRKNGSSYWEHTSIVPIVDNQKIIRCYFAIKEEITNHKEIEDTLRIKDNALLSSINAIVLTDLAGNITYVNPSFLGLWEYDSEKRVLGRPVYSLWKSEGGYVSIMDEITKKNGWLGELVAKTKNGKLFHVQMSASMVKDEFDKPLCIMASFVDITNQKRLEKKYKKFKTISDEADYGSILFDTDGTILYVNTSFASIHGYTISDLLGKNLVMFYPQGKKDILQKFLSDLKENEHLVGKEVWHLKKDQTLFPILMTATLIKDSQSGSEFAAGTIIDITHRKEAEKKIQKDAEILRSMNHELQKTKDQLAVLNKNLEKEVEKRTEKIRRLIKQKDDFINQLGHDLKTPLTPMYVLLPMLKNSLDSDDDKKSMDIVIRNIHFMKDLVSKTIDLAKLNSETIDVPVQKIRLNDVVREMLDSNQTQFLENQISVTNNIEDDIEIVGNELRLKEVFNNLFSNAVKYMSDGDKSVTIDAMVKDDGILVSVADSGMGMTKEQCDHIFDEFYKVDESRHHLDSTGLGLTITKKIIEKHGGTIWAESPGPMKGTTFYFTLPTKLSEKHENNNI